MRANDGIEDYAVLMGNTPLYPQHQDYLGFDGTPMEVEFNDGENFSEAGGFRRFLDNIGISREASQRRRSLRDRKQRMAEQQQMDQRRSQQSNMRLQQQAIKAAAAAPSGADELKTILASQQPMPTAAGMPAASIMSPTGDITKQGFWKKLKTWQKIAIIGGGVLVAGTATYFILKSRK
jgi:hypothetical protein